MFSRSVSSRRELQLDDLELGPDKAGHATVVFCYKLAVALKSLVIEDTDDGF